MWTKTVYSVPLRMLLAAAISGTAFAGMVLRAQTRTTHGKGETISVNDLRVPENARNYYRRGLDALRKRDFQKATELLHKALAACPTYAKAHNAIGIVFAMTNRIKDSELALRKAVSLDGASAEMHFNLGKLLLEADRFSESREELQKAFDLDSGHGPTIALLVDSMVMIHDEESAVMLMRSVHLKNVKHAADLHLELASALESHGKNTLAAEQYALLLEHELSDTARRQATSGLERTQKH